jgi:hypothetical protein
MIHVQLISGYFQYSTETTHLQLPDSSAEQKWSACYKLRQMIFFLRVLLSCVDMHNRFTLSVGDEKDRTYGDCYIPSLCLAIRSLIGVCNLRQSVTFP